MGEMADYFIDSMQDEERAVRNLFEGYPGLDGMMWFQPDADYWVDADEVWNCISDMTDEHLGAAIGWCIKHFPEESKAKVVELKAEQCRREFG
jgi:hypothetical protein